MVMDKFNFYIFVIWERARENEDYIFSEIKKKFSIKDVYEIEWKKENFPNNLRRFYGPGKVGDVDKKTKLCKTGPFLLVIVSDPNPIYEKRRTSKGMELVNINLFECKRDLRNKTEKGYAIHCSLTKKETNDDLTLLLGKNLEDSEKEINSNWNGKIKQLKSDLIGQNGWKNMQELLYVLNSTVNYVVLRNYDGILENLAEYRHADIDILTDEYIRIPYITNGGKASFNEKFPKTVKIDNNEIKFDFGYPEDGYYDEKWLKNVLKRRVLHKGIYVPFEEDYFYTLLYHAVIHQKNICTEYQNKLKDLAKEINMNDFSQETFENINLAKIILEKYMEKNKYYYTYSTIYKIKHNKISRIFNTSILLLKTQGINFLLTAIKGKIKRGISKSNSRRFSK
jgi:hypothetical protein